MQQGDVSQSDGGTDKVTHAIISQLLLINKETSARVAEELTR